MPHLTSRPPQSSPAISLGWKLGSIPEEGPDGDNDKLEMRGATPVRSSSLDTTSAGAEVVTGQVTEVTKDTFWPIVKAAGEKVVVLDMYTQWYRLGSTNHFFISVFFPIGEWISPHCRSKNLMVVCYSCLQVRPLQSDGTEIPGDVREGP